MLNGFSDKLAEAKWLLQLGPICIGIYGGGVGFDICPAPITTACGFEPNQSFMDRCLGGE